MPWFSLVGVVANGVLAAGAPRSRANLLIGEAARSRRSRADTSTASPMTPGWPTATIVVSVYVYGEPRLPVPGCQRRPIEPASRAVPDPADEARQARDPAAVGQLDRWRRRARGGRGTRGRPSGSRRCPRELRVGRRCCPRTLSGDQPAPERGGVGGEVRRARADRARGSCAVVRDRGEDDAAAADGDLPDLFRRHARAEPGSAASARRRRGPSPARGRRASGSRCPAPPRRSGGEEQRERGRAAHRPGLGGEMEPAHRGQAGHCRQLGHHQRHQPGAQRLLGGPEDLRRGARAAEHQPAGVEEARARRPPSAARAPSGAAARARARPSCPATYEREDRARGSRDLVSPRPCEAGPRSEVEHVGGRSAAGPRSMADAVVR